MIMGICIALLIFLGLPAALIVGYQWGRAEQRQIPAPRALPFASPEILRRRYAAGALTRLQYQDALVDVLKDRRVLSLAE